MYFLTSYKREEQSYVIIEMHVCRLGMYSNMKDPIIREQKCICNILLCEQGQGFSRIFYAVFVVTAELLSVSFSLIWKPRIIRTWNRSAVEATRNIKQLYRLYFHHLEGKKCSDRCYVQKKHERTSCERIKLITQIANIGLIPLPDSRIIDKPIFVAHIRLQTIYLLPNQWILYLRMS